MIIPVIHCLNWHQIKTNLEVCQRQGVTNVFLINHSHGMKAVLDLSEWVRMAKEEFPSIGIGVNFLQLETPDAITEALKLNSWAVWSDLPGGVTDSGIPLFGPVAFKYQKHVPDWELESVCKKAMTEMNVVTTSGPGTGQPASIKKIEAIRSYIGDFPLAIASGVNLENKKLFEPLVDYILVASSITSPENELIIESKLEELLK